MSDDDRTRMSDDNSTRMSDDNSTRMSDDEHGDDRGTACGDAAGPAINARTDGGAYSMVDKAVRPPASNREMITRFIAILLGLKLIAAGTLVPPIGRVKQNC